MASRLMRTTVCEGFALCGSVILIDAVWSPSPLEARMELPRYLPQDSSMMAKALNEAFAVHPGLFVLGRLVRAIPTVRHSMMVLL